MNLADGLVLVPVRPACERPLRPIMSRRVKSSDYSSLILSTWRRMMTIVATPSHATYDPSVVVCEDWYDISLFARDVVLLPGWTDAPSEPILLSRKYYGANCFSPDTARWTTRSDNKIYNSSRHVAVDSVVYLCESDALAACGVSISRQVAHALAGREVVTHGGAHLSGHVVSIYTPPDGYLLRRE